jgi:hypothetical protein
MMTTNGMSCELFNDRLMAYFEYETDEQTRVAMERHAVTCGDCGPLLADLRKLRIDAANLPGLVPSRDLWSGIAERIEAPVVAIGATVSHHDVRSAGTRRWMSRSMIAASLVAAAGIGYLAAGDRAPTGTVPPMAAAPGDTQVMASVPDMPALVNAPTGRSQRGNGVTPPPAANTPAGPATVAAGLPPTGRQPEVQLAIATLTADYDREIARLRALVEQRRSQLDPATVAVIERSLMVIDTAITQSKQAIARDPASRFLIESLNQSLQAKVELMRTAAVLPSRT